MKQRGGRDGLVYAEMLASQIHVQKRRNVMKM